MAALMASLQPTESSCISMRLIRSRVISLNLTVSSDVINETNVASVPECLLRCRMRGCAVAVARESERICQLVVINEASKSPGPMESHVTRVLSSEIGDSVWTVDNLDELLRKRSYSINVLFKNSSSGSNGSVQQQLIGLTGCYRIEAAGARGGSNSFKGTVGGNGATAAGNFSLTAGTRLLIVVGQAGGSVSVENAAPGGGGGSFVWIADGANMQLLLAAGGGGGSASTRDGLPGESGSDGSNSVGASSDLIGFGGIVGQPGFNVPSETWPYFTHGGCGAGWLGKAVNSRRSSSDGERGGSLDDNWLGGSGGDDGGGDGGFGGGGGGGDNSDGRRGAPGAGGGFSGGGAGLGDGHSAGGGGSVCIDGSDCVSITGGNVWSKQGSVTLMLLSTWSSCF